MCGRAAVGTRDRLDVLGPLPSGLEGGSTDRARLEVDQLQFSFAVLEEPYFFWVVETLLDETGHCILLVVLGRVKRFVVIGVQVVRTAACGWVVWLTAHRSRSAPSASSRTTSAAGAI